jgi:hypothetical protein
MEAGGYLIHKKLVDEEMNMKILLPLVTPWCEQPSRYWVNFSHHVYEIGGTR